MAAGRVDAAAASDMFVIVMKTGKKKGVERGNHASIFTASRCEEHCKQAESQTRTTVTNHHTSSSKSGLLNFSACFRGQFYSNIKAYTV